MTSAHDDGVDGLAVADHIEIQQLYARYSHTIDSGDVKGWADTFTEDGMWRSDTACYRGSEQLAAFAETSRNLLGGYRHVQTNMLLSPNAEGVDGSSYLLFLQPDPGRNAPTIINSAVYRDSIVRTPAGWRFAIRRLVIDALPSSPALTTVPTPDGAGGPSRQLHALVEYLRATPVTPEAMRAPATAAQLAGVTRCTTDLGGVPAVTIEPLGGSPDLTVLYFHGGGYVSGSPPEMYLPMVAGVAIAANARVHVVDYRLAPEVPFPGAFEDCLNAYRWLQCGGGADARQLAVFGDSAGANLALAVTVAARDERLPLPTSVALISPFADLTFSGPSIEQRKDLDPYVSGELLELMAAAYVGDGSRDDPHCSTVFADLHGLPPLFIQVGENEILYDDATRIRDAARTAGVDVTFESWRHGFHVWPVFVSAGLPESAAAIERLAAFLKGQAILAKLR
jgi:monoterpene epsilon-lactone hydrolase